MPLYFWNTIHIYFRLSDVYRLICSKITRKLNIIINLDVDGLPKEYKTKHLIENQLLLKHLPRLHPLVNNAQIAKRKSLFTPSKSNF